MPLVEPTEIRIDEDGNETHESWLLIRANHVNGTARLFDSEITHRRFIQVTVTRCTRKRDINRDWLHGEVQPIIEINMSEAQWGAFVSSFGNGGGVPATLSHFNGSQVPRVAEHDSRLSLSHKEVKNAASKAVAELQAAHAAVDEAFERGAGKKEMRDLLRNLRIKTENLPANMEYTAKSMSEHVENVVVKARADVEGMVIHAIQNGVGLNSGDFPSLPELLDGEK